MHPLDSILDRWRQEEAGALFSRTRAMGTAFEDLCAAFLTHDPIQSLELRDVKTFADWARERDLDQTDTGIDLVAELRNEPGFAAIQCKFLQTGTTVPNSEIASFLAASGRPEFRRRILIDTTGRPWSRNAENTLRDQAILVQRIGLHDLKASPIQWADYATSDGEVVRTPPKTARPHQQQAIDSALSHLESPGTRGKLLMACGTGKTLVGLRIAETLAGRGGRVLVLVPSLALLSQTLRAWVDDTELPVRTFAVCSDSQTGRPRRSADDTADMDVLDLAYPATTDPARLAKAAEPDAPDRMTVVFATYQSSGVLEEAQQRHGLPAFDLAIADEAHRTAGALIPGEDPSPFVRIHDNEAIRAGRRLYMTATAKVYAESARTRAGKLAATLCSMDDEDRYGPVLHETRFGDAVEQGLLADYRVIVLTVPEALAAQVTIRNFAEGETLTIDEQGRMIGCLRALAKTDTDQFPEDDRAPMRRAIAFCNFIKSSQQLEQRIHDVAEGYADYTGDTDAPPVSARHVDGTFNAAGRADALAFLDETPDDETRILTNARCLTEGVDVPALDGILFMHPRKSQIEVVQAVGRVMRQAPGKKLGYIILPVVVPSTGTPEQALDDDTRWRTVWQMLNAIRSHDERFEGMLNRLGMGDSGDRVSIIALADWRPASEPSGDNRPAADPHAGDTSTPAAQQQAMVFEGLPEAIRTKIVEKCGNRRYWEEWAGDVARIARAHIERIRAIIDSGEAERAIFHEFLDELRDDLNPGVMENEAIEMLAQHMVTKPVFDALFGDAAAAHRNAVSQGMQTVLDVLEPAGLDREAETLDAFYESVRRRVQGAGTAEARQKIVVELYDKFFRNAFPRMTQRLGIVYTPVEIVDFILGSVQHVLREEFRTGLADPDVHVLDPFTGTGTFITRLMQSGMLSRDEIVRKYGGDGRLPELHANEIVLLAYYIASVNIETAFQGETGGAYQPFDGICLTDTFAMHGREDLIASIFPDNSGRRTRQKNLDIRVIVGNPPWSAGQRSAADDNPNVEYPEIEARIAKTYAARSTATLKNSLYDTYKMAIRWASDRIGEQGVVAFVTNGSWIDGNVDSGIRACLAEEFSSIHVVNLRGNQRTQGERSRQEGGKVFGQGSRAPVAITVLVRNPNASHEGCRIHYRDIGDYLTREEKLKILSAAGSIAGVDDWQTITPNRHHDWIGQRDEAFQNLIPIGSKEAKSGRADGAIFGLFSNGYKTGRDAYVYNFSRDACAENARKMVGDYLGALRELEDSKDPDLSIDEVARRHSSNLRWDDKLKRRIQRRVIAKFSVDYVREVAYRPFVKQCLYADQTFSQRPGMTGVLFPAPDTGNRAICVPGVGSTKPFSALVVDTMPDLELISKGQCFPRYRYERRDEEQGELLDDAHGPKRIDNIPDSALAAFRAHYADGAITKDAIFDYVYGTLHASDFRERFANDLAKQLPRVAMADDFRAFAEAGRALAVLHLGYETCDEYPLTTDAKIESPAAEHYRIGSRKMRYADDDRAVLIVNDYIRLSGIPAEAHRYAVNGRTPLEWFIDRYRITRDSGSGIVNDPNGWFADPRDLVSAIRRIVHLSVETVRIVEALPNALDADGASG